MRNVLLTVTFGFVSLGLMTGVGFSADSDSSMMTLQKVDFNSIKADELKDIDRHFPLFPMQPKVQTVPIPHFSVDQLNLKSLHPEAGVLDDVCNPLYECPPGSHSMKK